MSLGGKGKVTEYSNAHVTTVFHNYSSCMNISCQVGALFSGSTLSIDVIVFQGDA